MTDARATTSPARGRILFLSGLQIHPTRSGGNLRSFALANALARHGFEVFVYSMVGRKDEYRARTPSGVQRWPDGVEEYVDRSLSSFLAGYGSYGLALPPLWATAYLRAAASVPVLLPRLLRQKLAWCDTVLADFPFVHPIFRSAGGKRRVLSTHNIEHHLVDGAGFRNRRIREAVRRVEIRAAAESDLVVACCAGDREFFDREAKARRSVLVPNGIDVRRFRGLETKRAEARRGLGLADDTKAFLFTASKYGPNREAFEFLRGFAVQNQAALRAAGVHILVVGNVTNDPVRLPAFTATGRVDTVEPFFAAADAALNPIETGAGTNVKMCEFIAVRLPILTTPFGARGFRIEDGATGFVFERAALLDTLLSVRRLFDGDPGRLARIAEDAYARNAGDIDMEECVRPMVEALSS
jgi:glycosyltransferase involved in cell wall biosynthesis